LLIEHRIKLFHVLVDQLGQALPDLGRRLAVDGKAIQNNPVTSRGCNS
jgi:hypothetical protein